MLSWSSRPRLASGACPDDARDSVEPSRSTVEPTRSTVEPPRSTVEPSRSTVSGLVTAGDLHQGFRDGTAGRDSGLGRPVTRAPPDARTPGSPESSFC